MEHEKVEGYLTELANGETTEERKSEILLDLQSGLGSVYKSIGDSKAKNEELEKNNKSLQLANANYFNKLSAQERDFEGFQEQKKEEVKKKATLTDLLRNK